MTGSAEGGRRQREQGGEEGRCDLPYGRESKKDTKREGRTERGVAGVHTYLRM